MLEIKKFFNYNSNPKNFNKLDEVRFHSCSINIFIVRAVVFLGRVCFSF